MLCYKDRTFCSSPSCKNECGRQATDELWREAKDFGLPLSVAQFCDENGRVSDRR